MRGGIVAAAIVLLLLGFSEFQQKQRSSRTGQAWIDAFDAVGPSGNLPLSKLESMIVGTPVRSTRPVPKDANTDATTIHTFVWRGRLRNYVIEVYALDVDGHESTVQKINVTGGH